MTSDVTPKIVELDAERLGALFGRMEAGQVTPLASSRPKMSKCSQRRRGGERAGTSGSRGAAPAR